MAALSPHPPPAAGVDRTKGTRRQHSNPNGAASTGKFNTRAVGPPPAKRSHRGAPRCRALGRGNGVYRVKACNSGKNRRVLSVDSSFRPAWIGPAILWGGPTAPPRPPPSPTSPRSAALRQPCPVCQRRLSALTAFPSRKRPVVREKKKSPCSNRMAAPLGPPTSRGAPRSCIWAFPAAVSWQQQWARRRDPCPLQRR